MSRERIKARVDVVVSALHEAQAALIEVQAMLREQAASLTGEIKIPVGATMAEAQREIILQTLAAEGGNKAATAKWLKIARRTVFYHVASSKRDRVDKHTFIEEEKFNGIRRQSRGQSSPQLVRQIQGS